MATVTGVSGLAAAASWRPVPTGEDAVAAAERAALSTSARVVIWPPGNLKAACAAADEVLGALDRQASRFRLDSELNWLHRAGGGLFLLSDGLAEAVGVALAAARWTGGLTDPTVGGAVIGLGYDRDFAAIDPGHGRPPAPAFPAPGWHRVRLDGPLLRLPAGTRLDLGATAKGLGADRAVRAAMAAAGSAGGVLVSLGGDIAVGGTAPRGGWPVTVAEQPAGAGAPGIAADPAGWRGGRHLLGDLPALASRRQGAASHRGPADRAARRRAVADGERHGSDLRRRERRGHGADRGGEAAEGWLAASGVPARLVGHDGQVRRLGGWPAADGQPLPVTRGSHVYAWGLR